VVQVRGVFFDLYGTLLIYGDMRAAWEAWLTSFYAGLAQRGLAMSRTDFALRCDGFFERAAPPGQADGCTVLERRIRALCHELDVDVEAAALRDIGESAAESWQGYVRLDPEAGPVLQALRRCYALALISNFDHPPHVRKVLARCGLAGAFDTIVVSGEVGLQKPDPRIFQLALEQTGLMAQDVLHIGDTDEDVRGACGAAIRPILIRRDGEAARAQPFDYHAREVEHRDTSTATTDHVTVVTRLSDILRLLQG
jgi:putative hydrolase of the HAD superfamily